MVRWKLRNRSKSTKGSDDQVDVVPAETKKHLQSQEASRQDYPEPEEVPMKEYNEVLYAQSAPVKKVSFSSELKKESKQRTSWENPNTIEQNVDRIRNTKAGTVASSPHVNDQIEKKVDRLIAKKKSER